VKKKGFLKAVIGIGLVLMLALAPFLSACPAPEVAPPPPAPPTPPTPAPPTPPPPAPPPKVYKVCITQIATHPDLDSNRQGIMDAMAEEGFIEGENIDFIIRNAEGDMTVAVSIADFFVGIKPDLIHAITTPSAQTLVAAAEGTDIPIVFSSVTDPVSAGLVPSWTEAAPNVTGVSDWFEMPPQVEFVLAVLPDVKVLGIAYNAGEVNAAVQAEIFNEVAPEYGLTVVEATAATTADVYAAGMSLVGRVDAIWIPTCNTVGGVGIESIIKVGEEHKIPIFGSAEGMIGKGLVGGCSVDYYWIGKQAGYMAAKILKGESIANIPPIKSAVKTVAYPASAERMGITIPQAVLDAADVVIEE